MELLLVEDEQYTRDGIIKFIDWKRLGIKKVYTAEDGLQGVDVARLHLPDIILADVRMPRMNGVEMARRIRTFHPDCELIFISGYSDREYLKSAIHLSALDYISKPLDLNELDEILSRAVEHVKKNNERQALVSYFMENELASVIVQDNVSNEEKMRLWSQLNSPRTDKLTLYTILMRQKYSRTTNLIIKEVAEKLGIWILLGRWEEFYLLHVAMKDTQSLLLEKYIKKLIKSSKFKHSKPIIAVGRPVNHPLELKESFRSARAAYNRHFYHPDKQVFIGKGRALSLDLGFDPTHEFNRLLLQEPEKAKQWLNEQFEFIRNYDGTPIELVRNWAFQMATVMYLLCHKWAESVLDSPADGAVLWQVIISLTSLDELKKFLNDGIDFIKNRSCCGDANLPVVLKAQRYIHLNYTNPLLSLNDIAEHVSLSSTYLCEIFKESTGQTINQYLNNCRLRHAQLLLQTTHMRIHEIAEACGYSGSNYFIKVFKKAMRITPQEYRKRNILI